MKKIYKIILILIAFLVVGAIGVYQYAQGVLRSVPKQEIKTELKILEVTSGETPYQIISKTVAEPMHPMWYKLWFRAHPELAKIKHGYYSLDGVYTLQDLFAKLTHGKQLSLNFTIVAGTRVEKILENLAKASLMKHSLTDPKILKQFISEAKYNNQNLEGLFLPNTYAYDPHSLDQALLQRAQKDLEEYLEKEWEARDQTVVYKSPYEALIMASIIEKETSINEEYALVSAVFNNRLKLGMKLQTDPTVIYGVKDHFDGKITKSHLKDVNPYNTYVIDGLPPTPIAVASRETIHAALHPAEVDYLFFVANGKGGHTFTSNLRDHNKAVGEYKALLKDHKVKSRKTKVKDQIMQTTNDLESSLGEHSGNLGNFVESLFDSQENQEQK